MKTSLVNGSHLRVLSVPALPSGVSDRLRTAWEPLGDALTFADAGLDCTAMELDLPEGAMVRAIAAAGDALRGAATPRLFRFEAAGVAEEDEASLRAALAATLGAAPLTARRRVPASQWIGARPIEFGVDGFAVNVQGATPQDARAALEFGDPLITMRIALHGVPPEALARLRDAAGSERGGLLHVGAAPAIDARNGSPLLVLSCSDHVKSPLHRALELIDIEARRYGGAVGAAALLSRVPLSALLETLAGRIALDAKPSQVIETKLAKPAR